TPERLPARRPIGAVPNVCDGVGSFEAGWNRERQHCHAAAYTGTEMSLGGESFDRWLTASVFFHGALFTFVIFSPNLFPAFQSTWCSHTGGSGCINVKIVGTVSSVVPLPRLEVVQEQACA